MPTSPRYQCSMHASCWTGAAVQFWCWAAWAIGDNSSQPSICVAECPVYSFALMFLLCSPNHTSTMGNDYFTWTWAIGVSYTYVYGRELMILYSDLLTLWVVICWMKVPQRPYFPPTSCTYINYSTSLIFKHHTAMWLRFFCVWEQAIGRIFDITFCYLYLLWYGGSKSVQANSLQGREDELHKCRTMSS